MGAPPDSCDARRPANGRDFHRQAALEEFASGISAAHLSSRYYRIGEVRARWPNDHLQRSLAGKANPDFLDPSRKSRVASTRIA